MRIKVSAKVKHRVTIERPTKSNPFWSVVWNDGYLCETRTQNQARWAAYLIRKGLKYAVLQSGGL